MLNIGITGGIGSGKTTVCTIFETLGIPIYFADTEAKKILQKDTKVKTAIKNLMGHEAYFSNGRPNKAYIAKMIFSNKALLEGMNSIVHPAVQRHSEEWFLSQKNLTPPPPFTLKEAALLVENGSYRNFDKIIVVTSPEDIRINRVMERDKVSEAVVRQRISHQLPEAEKIAIADYVIINDGQYALIPQVVKIYHELLMINK